MDTLSFALLPAVDDAFVKAAGEFGSRQYARALSTLASLPALVGSRPDVLELKAQCQQALGHWSDAIAAWEELLRLEPANRLAGTHLPRCSQQLRVQQVFRNARTMHAAGRCAESLQALEELAAEWREHPEFHRLKGLCHERVGAHAEALCCWTRLLEVDAASVEAAVHVGMCHAALGNTAEAARASRAAAERHPTNMHAQFQWLFVRVSSAGGDADVFAFVAEIERLRSISGNSIQFRERVDGLRTMLSSLEGVGAVLARHLDADASTPSAPPAPGSLRSIYEAFEPLGSNCEFGLVQRQHGAEPLSLFRWTSITAENLIRLARDKLEGYDSPERYQFDRLRTGELVLKETTYWTASHTLVTHSDADPEALIERLLRRQAFLKRKLLETLAEGSKILVHKCDGQLAPATMQAMLEALRPLGARKMLFVMRARAGDAPASVRIEAPGVAVAFLSDVMPNTQFAEWDAIVQRVHAAFSVDN